MSLNTCSVMCLFLQECPTGIVNEDTFKDIYGQFFPHGGNDEESQNMFRQKVLLSELPWLGEV